MSRFFYLAHGINLFSGSSCKLSTDCLDGIADKLVEKIMDVAILRVGFSANPLGRKVIASRRFVSRIRKNAAFLFVIHCERSVVLL